MRATAAIQLYSKKILQPTYDKLDRLSQEALTYIAPDVATLVTADSVDLRNWKAIAPLPSLPVSFYIFAILYFKL